MSLSIEAEEIGKAEVVMTFRFPVLSRSYTSRSLQEDMDAAMCRATERMVVAEFRCRYAKIITDLRRTEYSQ